jgi:hypothetical protein
MEHFERLNIYVRCYKQTRHRKQPASTGNSTLDRGQWAGWRQISKRTFTCPPDVIDAETSAIDVAALFADHAQERSDRGEHHRAGDDPNGPKRPQSSQE